MTQTTATDRTGDYYLSRRDRYHRAVNPKSEHSGVACGAGTRDMTRTSMMVGGAMCVKCFPSGAVSA